jgi:hypothetical protein
VSGNVGERLGRDPIGGDSTAAAAGQLLRRLDGHNEPVQIYQSGRSDSGELVGVLAQRRDQPQLVKFGWPQLVLGGGCRR